MRTPKGGVTVAVDDEEVTNDETLMVATGAAGQTMQILKVATGEGGATTVKGKGTVGHKAMVVAGR